MKVKEAIAEADELKPNVISQGQKIKWLSRLDLRIKQNILDTHLYNEGETAPEFSGYTDASLEAELLVPEPHSEMYVHWLSAQIDYYNMEPDGFNAANGMFESVYTAFRNYYNQHHMPAGTRKTYY